MLAISDQENDGEPKAKKPRRTPSSTLQPLSLPAARNPQNLPLRTSHSQIPTNDNNQFRDSFAGVIKKVEIINFMCHSHFEIIFNPKINFISGVNGSGKSAVQTALVIGLGGTASKTCRSNKIDGLIKHGCNSSKIEITLSNTGKNAYKPEEYGDEIKIIRNITHSSAQFKIENKFGKVINIKKSELDNVMANFRIQPNNPVSILNQDMAKNFLSTNKAESKYSLFKKATLLDEAEEECGKVQLQIEEQKEYRETKLQGAKQEEEEIKIMSEKHDLHKELKRKKGQEFDLTAELLWSQVNEDRKKLKELEEIHEKQMKIKEDVEKDAENIAKEIEKNEKDVKELNQKLDALKEEANNKENYVKTLKEQYTQDKQLYEKKCYDYDSLITNIRTKKADKIQLKESLDDIAKEEAKQKEQTEKTMEEIERLKEVVAENNSKVEKLEMDAKAIKNMIAEYSDQWKQKERTIAHTKMEINTNRSQLSNMTKSDNLSKYAQWMPALVQKINAAEKAGIFSKPPRGPLGQYIKVKNQKWSAVIESHLGASFLCSFFVNSNEDREHLYRIMEEVVSRKKSEHPTVFRSTFQEQARRNLANTETNSRPYTNIYRTITVSDVTTANFLMDQRNVHQILLVDNKEDCRNFFCNDSNVPRNCKMALDMDGKQYLPGYKVYAYMGKLQNRLLQKNVSDFINTMKEEIAFKEKIIENAIRDVEELKNTARNSEAQAKNLFDMSRAYKQKISQYKSRIEELTSMIEMEMPTLQDKLEELNNIDEEIVKLENEKQSFLEERDKALNKMQESRRLVNNSKLMDSISEQAKINNQLEQINKCLPRLKAKEGKCRSKVKEQILKIKELESRITNQLKKVTDECDTASQVCNEGECTMIRSPEEVKADLREVKAFIEEGEKKLGNCTINFEKEFIERKQNYKRVSEDIKDFTFMHEKFEAMLEDRRGTIKRIRDLNANVIIACFQKVLQSRKYQGRLVFDHTREKLDIIMAGIDGGDAMMNSVALSGGEKSYSTIAFLMALWSNMELPFYSLDEYDVFMDGINRRAITELLISFAKRHDNRQFIFLSPLDTSIIQTGPDVEVHRVKKIV